MSENVDLRTEVRESASDAFAGLGRPGATWTGAERRALADEVRRAAVCGFCAERRAALTPHAVDGAHDAGPDLPAAAVDAVHRIATDSGRLSTRWHEELLVAGVSEAQLVELIGVTVTVIAVDTLHRSLGVERPELPAVVDGAPTGETSTDAVVHTARVPTVPPESATGVVAELYGLRGGAGVPILPNIIKALTLVPSTATTFLRMLGSMYPSGLAAVPDAWGMTRPQIELVAASVSAHNDCFY